MIVNIKAYPALNGDCILISYGEKPQKHLLVDCGYMDTYKKHLKNQLLQIAEKGEHLERLIITHIDADHILGAIPLVKENVNRFIEIKDVWHNTFRHLFKEEKPRKESNDKGILKRIINKGYYEDKLKSGESTISAEQGTTVGALLLKGKYSWNSDFAHRAVCIENRQKIQIDNDTRIYLLSPNKNKLNNLKELWRDELRKYGINYTDEDRHLYDDAFEILMSWEKDNITKREQEISSANKSIDELLLIEFGDEDKTATNGSSIAFVLEVKEKRLLLLADAHPNLIIKSLYNYQSEGIIYFDLIKVAHHGSCNNISKELLSKIDSQRYLISTNGGKHKHPDLATIAHIVGRPAKFHRYLYFNYETGNSEYFSKREWMDKYNYSICYIDQEPYSIDI